MLRIDGRTLTLESIAAVAGGMREVTLSDEARARIEASRAIVDRKAAGPDAVYGVNTGFGSFADVRIDAESLDKLQVNLLRSHAAGVGAPLRRTRRARDDAASRQRAGARSLRHPRLHGRCPAGAPRRRRSPGRAEPWIGRRERRSGAARPSRAGAHRRGRGAQRRRAGSWRGGPRQGRPVTGRAGPEGGTGAHQRHAGVDGSAGPGAGGRRAARPGRGSGGGALDRCAPGVEQAVRRANSRRPPACRAGRLGRQPAAAHGRKCNQCLACRLRARTGRVLRALRGPGARRGTRRARVCAPDGRNRSERVDGQPDGLRRAGRDRLGRQLPWRAGGDRGGSHRHRRRAVRDDQREAVRAAGQPRAQRPARLPHRAWRASSRD